MLIQIDRTVDAGQFLNDLGRAFHQESSWVRIHVSKPYYRLRQGDPQLKWRLRVRTPLSSVIGIASVMDWAYALPPKSKRSTVVRLP